MNTTGQSAEGNGSDIVMKDADAGAAAKPAGSKKKKGIASVVKPAKKGKSGGKKAKTSRKKKSDANEAPSSPDAADAASGSSESESDHGPYCVCRGPDDHRWMIQCDGCEDWFHGECVQITKELGETLIQSYICPNCTDGRKYVTRYKKTCSLESCMKPARIYNAKDPSIFCSQDHCNLWWEQLVATLPRNADKTNQYRLGQEDFMGLLTGSSRAGSTWQLGDTPFGVFRPFLCPSPSSTRQSFLPLTKSPP